MANRLEDRPAEAKIGGKHRLACGADDVWYGPQGRGASAGQDNRVGRVPVQAQDRFDNLGGA